MDRLGEKNDSLAHLHSNIKLLYNFKQEQLDVPNSLTVSKLLRKGKSELLLFFFFFIFQVQTLESEW